MLQRVCAEQHFGSASADKTQFTIDHGQVVVTSERDNGKVLKGAGASASIGGDGATQTKN